MSKDKNISEDIKLVVVGDGAVGKTCMLITYTSGKFPDDYIPTLFDNFHKMLTVADNISVRLSLYDTAGQEDYDQMRPLSYDSAKVFLVCYSCNSRNSFENVKSKWCPEVRQHVPDAPIVLVGTKKDMRGIDGSDNITAEEGESLKDDVGAEAYLECSAKTMEGLNEVFSKAVEVVLRQSKQTSGKGKGKGPCIIS